MGSRWGMEDPPPEAYSRVTNPERFAPLHGFAERLLDRLESTFVVTREEGYGLDPNLEGRSQRTAARPTVRLEPGNSDAGSLTIAFDSFPGIWIRAGHWCVEVIPSCGCDACDETVEEGQQELEDTVEALTSGRLSEWIQVQQSGDAWLSHHLEYQGGSSSGKGLIPRARARELIKRADGRSRFDYRPWPRR